MQKIVATLFAVVMLALFTTPAAIAAESVSSDYDGALGYYAGPVPRHPVPDQPSGRGLALVVCPESCDLNDVCETVPEVGETCLPNTGLLPVVDPIGGARLVAGSTYSNVIISISDDAFGSGGANSACFWNPDGDNTCFPAGENPDYQSAWDCGSKPLLGSPFAADFVTVWIITILVSDDFDVCGGTTGTVTGDFF